MRMSGRVLSYSDPHLVSLDSVEYLGNGRVGAFGDGGFTLYDVNFALCPVAAFTPQQASFLGYGGCLCGTSLIATAADGSIYRFDDAFYP
jgi:hypothetical protein